MFTCQDFAKKILKKENPRGDAGQSKKPKQKGFISMSSKSISSLNLKIAKALNNGGRALNAIWENRNIDSQETVVLMYLGSQIDFTGEWTASVPRFVSTIAAKTKLSESTVVRRLKTLQEKKYITSTPTTLANGSRGANLYALTDRIFEEYMTHLEKKYQAEAEGVVAERGEGGVSEQGGVVAERGEGGVSGTPINPISSFPSISSSHMDGSLALSSQPRRKSKKATKKDFGSSDLVGVAQDFEEIFSKRSKFINYNAVNLTLSDIYDKHGKEQLLDFVSFAKEYVFKTVNPNGIEWKDGKMKALLNAYTENKGVVLC